MAEVQIINRETGVVDQRFDVTGRTNRYIEKVMRGVQINLDNVRYRVERTAESFYGLRVHTTDGPVDYHDIIKGTLRVGDEQELTFRVDTGDYELSNKKITIPGGTWSHWEPLGDEPN